MTIDLENLELNKSYKFDVVVEAGKDSFAGELNLTPEKCTIMIMGEQNEERNCTIGWDDIDKLVCNDLNKEFLLYDLKCTSGSSSVIARHPKSIRYFTITFEVGFVIFFPSNISNYNAFRSISIHSKTICDWIGNTEKQQEIIRSYQRKDILFNDLDKLVEFMVDISGFGRLGVSYNLSMYSLTPEFKSGISFPPSLNIVFTKGNNAKEIKHIYDRIYNLFAFLTGDELSISRIDIGYTYSHYSNTGSLYYPSRTVGKEFSHNYIFYPLGKDIKYDSIGLPPMPLEIFNNYFSLSDLDVEYWGKYLKYKRMENVEERFLGFFRILEALCYKKKVYLDEDLLANLCCKIQPYLFKKFKDRSNVKSFIKGLPRYNGSKYNTEKCIQDFFELIPKELSNVWKFEKKDIGNICKLRNDITHANNYYVSESEIEEKTKFIETILILSLCLKIGLRLDITAKFIHRINEYYLITRM